MSSEVPLDLSNESKPIKAQKKKSSTNSNAINGTKSGDKSIVKEKRIKLKSTPALKLEIVGYERQSKRAKLFANSNVNPLQRGKYGLRMMPQQVDYYQSILEDRRIKMYKHSNTQNITITEHFERKVKPIKVKQIMNKVKPISSISKYEFEIGEIVWATLPNYKTWFPALMISHMHCKQKPAKKGHTWVYWFGDHQVSEIPKSKIKPFIENFSDLSKGTSSLNSLRMKEALQVLASRANITFALDECVASSSNSTDNDSALISWAKNGFQLKSSDEAKNSKELTEIKISNPFSPDPLNPIPSIAACYLPLDSIYQEALKTDERLQQIVYYDVDKTENSSGTYEIPDYKLSQIERIRSGAVRINDVCIACYCDAESAVFGGENTSLLEHPLFEGGLCRLCFDNIKVTMYAPGADNKNSFCAICGQLGKLAICENENCHRVYCLVCIDLLVGSGVHLKVLETDKWECYLCKTSNDHNQLLKPRVDWRFNIKMIFDPLVSSIKAVVNDQNLNVKRNIRVLSLIDGIATAKIALEKLGLKIDSYYAIDSDSDAVDVAKFYHKDSIIHIENLENLTIDKIASISPIDFVIGASPHESSFANSSRKGFLDLKGSGHFLLYFNHILHLLRLANKGHHVFFLYENSNLLSNTQKDVISNILMCKPVTLYANDFCQNRNRYYWSNIPGIKRPLPPNIQEKFISLINILSNYTSRKRSLDKSHINLSEAEKDEKNLNPAELEKLFGLKENYTDVNALTSAKRQAVLAKSWCIPILSHLLWSLNDFFLH